MTREKSVCEEPPEVSRTHTAWQAGGSPVPYARALLANGEVTQAVAVARVVLGASAQRLSAEERRALQDVLSEVEHAPAGWDDALDALVRAPSVDAWDALIQLAPPEAFDERLRGTVAKLVALGVDADFVFACASRYGAFVELMDLAERGLVSPQAIVARARTCADDEAATWVALAARSAWARGDSKGAAEWLRVAYAWANEPLLVATHAQEIRSEADDAAHALLDAAGVPRFRSPRARSSKAPPSRPRPQKAPPNVKRRRGRRPEP